MTFPSPDRYRSRWTGWVRDPLLETHGLTFDRTPSGPIIAPVGSVRVCAWNSDFDERPTCYLDVPTQAEALWICANFSAACAWSVDFVTAHDETGQAIVERSF